MKAVMMNACAYYTVQLPGAAYAVTRAQSWSLTGRLFWNTGAMQHECIEVVSCSNGVNHMRPLFFSPLYIRLSQREV